MAQDAAGASPQNSSVELPPVVVEAPEKTKTLKKEKKSQRATSPVPVTAKEAAVSATKQTDVPAGAEGVVSYTGYVADTARSATKTSTPLLEVPQSVSVVTKERLEDMKPRSLEEAVSYTPGVRVGQYGFDPRYDAFKIRGVDVTYSGIFRDGLRQVNSPDGVFRLEPYGLEAISVLRGPAAAIYGASSTGGIVDMISKRPLEQTFREVEFQTGSFERLQGNFDFSGPATSDGTLLYRLTGVVRDAGTELDAVKDDRFYIAPAFTWKPPDATRFTLLSEYMDSTTGGTAAYINTYDGPLSTGVTNKFGGDARFNDFNQKQGRIGYEFEHRFDQSITLHQNVRYSKLTADQEYMFGGYPGLTQEDTSGFVADTYLVSRFAMSGLKHTLLTGVDFSYLDWTARWASGDYTTEVPPASLPYVLKRCSASTFKIRSNSVGGGYC